MGDLGSRIGLGVSGAKVDTTFGFELIPTSDYGINFGMTITVEVSVA